jgi:nucleoside 2-deoxyribosyltransferase
MDSLCLYCAGPLFNRSERDEMTLISEVLVNEGHSVYLPHRDGMEFRLVREVLIERGWAAEIAGEFLHEAIFALDVYQLAIDCDAMVWNMNGRVPDEGAVSEAAIAWSLGKPLIAYHDDVRSMVAGRMNPLLAGLVEFTTVSCIDDIPAALSLELQRTAVPKIDVDKLPTKLRTTIERGGELWKALRNEEAFGENNIIADCVTTLFAPSSIHKPHLTRSRVSDV